jgi:hypothetical protein
MGRVSLRIWRWLELGWDWIGRRFAGVAAWADVIGLLLVAATGALALAHSADFPSEDAWSSGHALPPIQIGAGILLVLTQVVLVVRGRKGRRDEELEGACRRVAAYIDQECPNLPLREVGVHIWTVAGPPFARHLRRSGSFLLIGDRARSGIRWTKDKGVVGAAWTKRTRVIEDLEEIRCRVHSPEQFADLPEDKKFGLSWDEFQRTPHYFAVCANPLYSRDNHSGQPAVRGILAIDLLSDGHCEGLERATRDSKFASVLGICEGALES